MIRGVPSPKTFRISVLSYRRFLSIKLQHYLLLLTPIQPSMYSIDVYILCR